MKKWSEKRISQVVAALCIIILCVMNLTGNLEMTVQAATNLSLNETKISIKSGETYKLKVESRSYKKSEVSYSYWYSSDDSIAAVNEKGKVTGYAPGSAVITYVEEIWGDYGYYSYQAECKITVKKGEYTLKTHEINMIEEDTVTMAIPEGVTVSWDTNYISYPMAYIDVYQDEAANQLVITAWGEGTTNLDVSFYNAKGDFLCTDRCTITVLQRGIDVDVITRAIGKNYTFTVNGYESSQIVSWESQNPEIATVSQNGKMNAIAEGTTYIILTVLDEYGEQKQYTCEVSVSNPQLVNSEQNLAVNCSTTIELTGLSYNSEVEAVSSKPEIVEANGTNLYAKAKGSATITLTVDGVKMKYKVRVTNPQVSDVLIAVVKGKTSQIHLSGTNSYSEVEYTTTNKKVATVSKTGKIKAVKNGTATIQIEADGKTFYVPVSVSNTKVVSALNYAIDAIGSAYSQAYRMSTGYYDCSSLAWRSYHTAGINFGNSSWAPTAAGIAEYLVNNNKAIAFEAVSTDELQPGDLLFFAREDNGRYKNIYHVAIYAGTLSQTYDYYGDSSTYDTGLLLEARNEGVGLFSYYMDARNVVVVARPTK